MAKLQLAPGESTKLTINVDVPDAYSKKFASCTLNTDHPQFKNWVYAVEFVSLPFIVADPGALNLGSFSVGGEHGEVKHVTLDAFSESKVDLKRDMFSVPEEIELKVLPNPEVFKLRRDVLNTRYKLSVGLSDRGRDAIAHNSRSGISAISIELTDGEARRWSYSVYWQALPPLVCHPSFLNFGNLSDVRDDHSKRVTITSSMNEKFKIRFVRSQSPDVLVESTFDPSDEAVSQRFTIKAMRHKETNKRFLTGSILVQTTAKVRPDIEIHWSATLEGSVKSHAKSDQPSSTSGPSL